MALEIEAQSGERITKTPDEDRLVDMLLMLRSDIKSAIRRQSKWIEEGKDEDIKMWDQGAKTMLEVVLKELNHILEDNGYRRW